MPFKSMTVALFGKYSRTEQKQNRNFILDLSIQAHRHNIAKWFFHDVVFVSPLHEHACCVIQKIFVQFITLVSISDLSAILQLQGSYRQVLVKFKDFSRTSKILSYCFQGLKTYEKY